MRARGWVHLWNREAYEKSDRARGRSLPFAQPHPYLELKPPAQAVPALPSAWLCLGLPEPLGRRRKDPRSRLPTGLISGKGETDLRAVWDPRV